MGQTVIFPSNGSTCDGYLALPDSGTGPGVVVIQEWWGLVDHITEVADRFAAAGYVALCPDLYRGAQTTEPDEAMKMMMGLQIARVATDLAGAAAYLAGHDAVRGERVGVVGFCMGGGLALLAGSVSDHLVAASSFYPATPWEGYGPDWSRYAGKELLIHRAEHDGPQVVALTDAWAADVRAAGGTATVHDYPGTSHAFVNDHRPDVHDSAATALAWDRTLALFARNLG